MPRGLKGVLCHFNCIRGGGREEQAEGSHQPVLHCHVQQPQEQG